MSRQLAELEACLQQLVAEHENLLRLLEQQQVAMKKLDVAAVEQSSEAQEACRLRIAAIESRRRQLVSQLASSLRLPPPLPTLSRLAEALPRDRSRLLTLRDRLRTVMNQVSARAQVVGRVAGAVVGHLNTALRLLAGAAEQAGLYTRHGMPGIVRRIGAMEAVA